MKPAKIAVFAFRRPDHLARCLESLAVNEGAEQHDLVIFCDGPRREADEEGVRRTREVARRAEGFHSLEIIERQENFGLAKSIITGVTQVLEAEETVIVVEDDLILAPHFLRFMRDGLDMYRDDAAVASILGYAFPIPMRAPESYFLRGTDCFGWATWRRAWAEFNPDARDLARQLTERKLERDFDVDGSYPYMRMLKQQIRGEVSSWAVRWYASAFLKNMVSLYPGRSLVWHGGDDALATHAANTAWLNGPVSATPIDIVRQPAVENVDVRVELARFIRRNKPGFLERARGWFIRRLNRLRENS